MSNYTGNKKGAIDVTAHFDRIQAILQDVPDGVTKAWKSIMSRAATTANSEAIKGITSVYDIKAKDVRDRENTTIRIKTIVEGDRVVGEITYSGNKIPLYRFGVKNRSPIRQKRGVQVDIDGRRVWVRPGGAVHARQLKDRAYRRIYGGFIATMPNGHSGIFQRKGRARLKIREVMGASTAQMVARVQVMDKVETATLETIAKRTEVEITRILNGYGAR